MSKMTNLLKKLIEYLFRGFEVKADSDKAYSMWGIQTAICGDVAPDMAKVDETMSNRI